MKTPLAALTVGLALLMGAISANAVPLYQGLKTPNQTPDQQGWRYLKTPFRTAPSATATTNGTVLDSGISKNYAGYFIQPPFNLDRTRGYAISFNIKINSEAHTKDNRAGFSVIVISNQLSTETQPYGLELGFWENKIFALNADASLGENISFNNKDTVRHFVLHIKGGQYQLFERLASGPILQGSLRQYTGYTPPAGFPNPYTTPNLVFMGDDTTSGTAKVTISNVYATPTQTIR